MNDNKRAKKGHIRPTYKCTLCEEMKDLSELIRYQFKDHPFVFFNCKKSKCGMSSSDSKRAVSSSVKFHYFCRGEDEYYPISFETQNKRAFLMCEIITEYIKRHERE